MVLRSAGCCPLEGFQRVTNQNKLGSARGEWSEEEAKIPFQREAEKCDWTKGPYKISTEFFEQCRDALLDPKIPLNVLKMSIIQPL